MSLDIALLRERLHYDPETGLFMWKKSHGGRAAAGDIAGQMYTHGYIMIGFRHRRYLAHRLAWAYVHGAMPVCKIDHKDRDPSNNRIANLRLASNAENSINRKLSSNNMTGYKGVYQRSGDNRFYATIGINGRQIYLGIYQTAEQAAEAYRRKALEVYGDFAVDADGGGGL